MINKYEVLNRYEVLLRNLGERLDGLNNQQLKNLNHAIEVVYACMEKRSSELKDRRKSQN